MALFIIWWWILKISISFSSYFPSENMSKMCFFFFIYLKKKKKLFFVLPACHIAYFIDFYVILCCRICVLCFWYAWYFVVYFLCCVPTIFTISYIHIWGDRNILCIYKYIVSYCVYFINRNIIMLLGLLKVQKLFFANSGYWSHTLFPQYF